MPQTRGPAPTNSELVDRNLTDKQFNGMMSIEWLDWANAIDNTLNQSFAVLGSASVASSGAAIGTTPITNTPLSSGLYRVSYYLEEIQADNISSDITVNFSWTNGTITRTLSGNTLSANSSTASQTGTLLLHIDASSPITYSTTYNSPGAAPPMLYNLSIVLERVTT